MGVKLSSASHARVLVLQREVEPTRFGIDRADLEARGFSQVLQRVGNAITTQAVWGVQIGAAREDVLSTWQQLVALHQKTHALLREKKDAELALGEEPSEANLAWLKDVGARLQSLDGTEALIEGFGELSGRFRQSV